MVIAKLRYSVIAGSDTAEGSPMARELQVLAHRQDLTWPELHQSLGALFDDESLASGTDILGSHGIEMVVQLLERFASFEEGGAWRECEMLATRLKDHLEGAL